MAATQHYQSCTLPINVPSKAPAPASLYPIGRVAGSPPDVDNTSMTAGSRTSGGFGYSSGSDYESSNGSYSGVDVVDVLNDRMQETFDPTPLDRGLVRQAQTYVSSHCSRLRPRIASIVVLEMGRAVSLHWRV